MTLLFFGVLFTGIALAGIWMVAVAVARGVDGASRYDPERRWGVAGRMVISACIGFGMGGFAILYTDLPPALSLLSALIGAVALAWVGRTFGPSGPE